MNELKNVLEYKGYNGSVSFSAEDKVFYGKIIDIRNVVTFEGETINELTKAFRYMVDDYISTKYF